MKKGDLVLFNNKIYILDYNTTNGWFCKDLYKNVTFWFAYSEIKQLIEEDKLKLL